MWSCLKSFPWMVLANLSLQQWLERPLKGDALNRSNYRGLKLINQVIKVFERVVEGFIRQRVVINDMQCGFMQGRGTTDAIFILRQLQEKQLVAGKPLYLAFINL